MSISSIEIVNCAPVRAAVVRLSIPRSEIHAAMGPAVKEIVNHVKAQENTDLAGPMFAHHLLCSDTDFDLEVGFPVSGTTHEDGNSRVYVSATPSGRAAKTTYTGSYEKLYEAWKEFGDALKEEHPDVQRRGETLWEVYTVGPESNLDAAKWQTELYLPIE
jgi:effector-binding domain-containing protein